MISEERFVMGSLVQAILSVASRWECFSTFTVHVLFFGGRKNSPDTCAAGVCTQSTQIGTGDVFFCVQLLLKRGATPASHEQKKPALQKARPPTKLCCVLCVACVRVSVVCVVWFGVVWRVLCVGEVVLLLFVLSVLCCVLLCSVLLVWFGLVGLGRVGLGWVGFGAWCWSFV